MKRKAAELIANELIDHLRPHCQRIEIAGSIRRGKPQVKDIEICYIPFIRQVVVDLWGNTAPHQPVDDAIDELIRRGILARDEDTKRWGPKYKRCIHRASGIVVELFAAQEGNWGVIFALRTGPAEFNRLLVSSIAVGGAMPFNIRMRDGYLWHQGQKIHTPTEWDFFQALDLPHWPAHQRTTQALNQHLQQRGSHDQLL
jgi:DNA polymerase/3'-5' exonuclease PolX